MSIIDDSANLNRWRCRSMAEKSLLAVGMLLIAVGVPSWHASVTVILVMIAITLLGARVAPDVWFKAILAPLGFLVFGAITLVLQLRGWRVSLAPHGLELAARLGARALAGTTCLIFLALTTPATDFIRGLRRLGVPSEIADLALLTYRFLFLLTDTANTMNTAQAARLGHSSFRRHLHSLSLLVAGLLPRSLARASALEVGLAARGWQGELRVLSPVRPVSPAFIAAVIVVEALVLGIGLRTT